MAALLTLAVITALASVGPSGDEEARAPVDFTREVRPVLSDRCFPCHGPDAGAREGGFRLDVREEALADLGGYAAIVPGDPEESELVFRVQGDADQRMPPPDSNLALTTEEIEMLTRWIAEGAPYARHWSFEPPLRSRPPAVDGAEAASWWRDPLDRFVLARLQEVGLGPAPEADRATWLRRASLDLTGLPPTTDELDAFLSDASEEAFERAADRLLASPAYGEHLASGWLELARYADTYGYQSDVARDVWPWRDWVIDAFNSNLPYDDFATWQLAGDLLPEATREQRLATTFNRLHRQTNEGGSTEEEYRVEYVSDRVNTFGMAFLGLTLECARCHDHKFDPIEQRDYYGLSAYFDDIDESGLYSHFTDGTPTPAMLLTTPEEEERLSELQVSIARAELRLQALKPNQGALAGCVGSFSFDTPTTGAIANRADPDKPGTTYDEPASVPGRRGLAIELSGENNASFPGVGAFRRWDPFSFSLWVRQDTRADRAVVLHRSRAWTDAASCGYQLLLEDGRPSFSLIHFWPGDALRVRALAPLEVQRWTHLAVTYDGSSRADGVTLYIDGVTAAIDVVRDGLTKDIVSGGDLVLTLGQRFRDRGFAGGHIDQLDVFERRLSDDEVALLYAGADPTRTASIDTGDGWWAKREELRALRRERAELVDGAREIMTMSALTEPRAAYVLRRGSYTARGEVVEPHVPAALGGGALASQRPDRLGLANWLTASDHPLFARVAVNRMWQLLWGRGLVETAEDFGSQGTLPSHPQLLDQLAREFADGGYDVKGLLRRLVLSATYRQSSRATAAAQALDPDNRLLSHAPSRRLSAEALRDAVLAASGLLVGKVGGPSVKPYQPPGLWKEKSGAQYEADQGEGLWRRSLYTFWKRTSPPPSMIIFDAGKREVCSARRGATNTPLQALVLWNDPQRIEAARVLAERVLRGELDDEGSVREAFLLLTARVPRAEESTVLLELLASERAAFRADPEAAEALLAIGSAPRDEDLEPTEVAALALVATTLFSYDAVVTLR